MAMKSSFPSGTSFAFVIHVLTIATVVVPSFPVRAEHADGPMRPGLVGPWYGNTDFTRVKGSDLLCSLALSSNAFKA